jgi:hypothetical protein
MRHKIKTMAFIAGISDDVGLETYLIKSASIRQDTFIEFLEKLSEVNND